MQRDDHSPSRRHFPLAFLACGAFLFAAAQAQDPEREAAPKTIPAGKTCLECHRDLFQGKEVHSPAADDCEACHLQAKAGAHAFTYPTPLEKLCAECHEPSEMGLQGRIHKPVAEGTCTACHDPHASKQPKLLREAPARLCTGCHKAGKGGAGKFVHGPYAGGLCQACHAPHASRNDHLLRRKGSGLCLACHEQLVPQDKSEHWHPPAKEDCTTCHSGHASETKFMLKAPQPKLCLACHEGIGEKIANARVKHKAVAEGERCTGCHDPHASRFTRLLRKEGADLCLACHNRTYPQAGARPLENIQALLEANPDHHGPIREKMCEGCHDPHGSANFRLLKKAYPRLFYAPFKLKNYDLCFSCHVKDFILQPRSTLTNFRDGDRNLHFLHVDRKKGRTCRACHEVHASQQPHHLRKTTPFGAWDLPIGFARTKTGGTCAPGCHVAVEYDREKKR